MSTSIGLALVVIAIVIFVIIAIWYNVSTPNQVSPTIWFILATALAILLIGVMIGSWGLMSRGMIYNHEGKPGIKGVHSPLM